MTSFRHGRAVLAAVVVAAAASAPAMAQDAHIRFHGGSVAFIAGVNWGGGTLSYKGRNVGLKVNGLSVGAVGANKFSASGEVYHLHRLRDIEGTYTALDVNATAGAGAGEIDMKNDKGVEIHAHASSAGLKLALAPSGVQIHIK